MNAVAPPSERIRAYLDGSLDEQAREDFELAMFDDPDLAEAVDAERLLRLGLRELETRRTRVDAAAVPPPRFTALHGVALAASLAVGILIGAFALPSRMPASTAIGGKTLFAALGVSRSAPPDELVIDLPADTPQLVLQFARPKPSDVRDYTLELELPDGRRASFAHLQPASDTQVSVGLTAELLPSGRYLARLVAIGNDGSRRDDQERRFSLNKLAAPR
ncbi:MAG TPA: hypothetical protein VLF18_10245 [Tahibacter sp.]|uniref:hypothetical protein n=1 Tax=Tahibacter sp. TaxID=2056211 RepID=UPI002CCDBC14|nr:hypothetical protein [Tahibacter sp.]HSX60568.1 hypothetical protein [Tahibacter sp.]